MEDAKNSHCGYLFLGVVETLVGHAHFYSTRKINHKYLVRNY